ncbi:MAG: trigger factor [Aestuariivirga sp.]|uniref:trigger factor n=1 Tax=Aestuariivirga sp. TaxID=2650926 RepID=UPI0025C03453|nr:trigger factor [Aestuariivirga sp.]MCA3562474.1 trigger factor [Aestuariivirga sp.]
MQVTETQNAGLRREYRVVVGQAELDKELNAKLADMSKRANIRGFRPGKVPVSHLKRVYGKSAMAEVLQDAVDSRSKRLLEDKNLKPAYQPEVKLPADEAEIAAVMDGKSDLAFTMALEVIPDFEVKDHSGLPLIRHMAEVAEDQIDETLKRLASQSRSFVEKQGGAEKGDRVTISFAGAIDGKPFDGGTAEDVALEIGSGQFIPGFEDQLTGARAGDEVTVKVSFPADYSVATLAGKPAEFATRVTKVEAPGEAPVDDDFARKMGFEDLAKLRDTLRQRIGGEFAQMSAMKLKRDVLDALDKEYSFELPEKLVEAEFNNIWNALSGEMTRAGKSFADENTTEEEARKEYRAIAERRVRLGLVLGRMGETQGVTVSEQELQNALLNRMRQFPGQEKMVIDYYRRNPGAMIELRGPIFEQKVVDAIVAAARVDEKTVTSEELKKMVEDEDGMGGTA